MESNRDEAYRCIELTKCYILKKDLDNAWKFSVKANKLFPSSESKLLMRKLKTSLKKAKRHSKKKRKKKSDDSDSSYNGDESSSSHNNSNTKQPTKKSKQSYKSSSTAYSFDMFKEINKDESLKCFEKAEEYIQKNQFELAIKFLLKSNKLFVLPKTNELLEKIQESKKTIQTYTEEQANIVKKVKNSENYYTMLGVKINASISEIKKAYKKLALLLHPDKNPAPGSGEVFVDLSNAVNTLCDNTKRTLYNQKLKKPTTFDHFFQSSYRQSPTTNTSFSSKNKNSNSKEYQNYSGYFDHFDSFYGYYTTFEEEDYCSTEDFYNDYYENFD